MASRVMQNFTWLTLGNAVAKPVWLAFLTLGCVRLLEEDGYGVFTATLALTAIVNTFADLGLAPYLVREVARRLPDAARYLTNFLVARLFLGFLMVLCSLGVGWFLGYRGGKLLALLLAGSYTFLFSLLDLGRSLFRAVERMEFEAVNVLLEKLFVIGLGLVLLGGFHTPVAVLGGMALGLLVVTLGTLGWIHRHLTALRLDLLDTAFLRRAVVAALPFGLAGQFVMIYSRTDAVMLDVLVGASSAGYYGAAYRIMESLMLISSLVTTAIYPRLSSLFHEQQHHAFHRLLRNGLLANLGIGLAVLAGLTVFASPLMVLIKGDASFEPAAGALRLLGWGVPFMCVNGVLATALTATDQQNRLLVWLGLSVLVNIGLNSLLIPAYTITGACVATLATEMLLTGMLAFTHLRRPWFGNAATS